MSLRPRSEAIHVFANIGAGGTSVIVAGVAGQIVRVYRLIVVNNTTTTNAIILQDTSNNALTQTFNLIANGSIVLDTPINEDPWWTSDMGGGGRGQGIQWNSTAAFGYDLWYLQGP